MNMIDIKKLCERAYMAGFDASSEYCHGEYRTLRDDQILVEGMSAIEALVAECKAEPVIEYDEERERAEFEEMVMPFIGCEDDSILHRLGSGYRDTLVDDFWKVWDTAWNAALNGGV